MTKHIDADQRGGVYHGRHKDGPDRSRPQPIFDLSRTGEHLAAFADDAELSFDDFRGARHPHRIGFR